MMKSYPSSYLYLNLILLSLIMILSSENWFFTWMAFEVSLFGFIPLLSMNSLSTEGMMKYFMVQAAGSSLYFISFLLSTNMKSMLTLTGLVMKLGIFPFFQWVPTVLMSLNWMNALILITLQKLGPLMVMLLMSYKVKHIIILASISILVSGLWGFNQLLMRPLMAYSSIAHTSWIMMTIPMNIVFFLSYIAIYFLTSAILFHSFKTSKTYKVMESKSKNLEPSVQTFSLFILLGLPPFSIFFMKLNIIMFFSNMILMVMLMILGTFMSTYYYLTFLIPMLLTPNMNNKMSLFFLLILNISPLVLLM